MRLPAAAVELGDIGKVIWVSLGAGVGITLAFSLVVFGSARSAEARRAGEGRALAYGALAVLGFLVFATGLIFGVQIMLSKD